VEKISIIIPTFNSDNTIKRTLNSVFSQSYKKWEILIIDSYSSDETVKFIKSFNSKKIKLYKYPKSKGLAAARSFGISKSTGNYISFLDSDDIWKKNKLFFQLNYMKKNNYNFCCTEYSLVNNKDKKNFSIKNNYIDYNFLLSNRPIALSTVMITKKLILSVSNKYIKNNFAEDYLWWIIILKNNYKCYVLKKNLTDIYITNNSRSENIMRNFISLFRIYRYNLKLNLFKLVYTFFLLFIKNFSKFIFKLYGLKN
jgi:teichuronic acid biosynthesis glycosyltransferase TuaG